MKNLFKLSVILLGLAVIIASCQKDEETFKVPVVTAPSTQDAEIGASIDVTFSFTSEAGFKSSTVAESNGDAVVTTDATSGAKSGTIVVSFTAGSTIGAGSVTLTITDTENQTNSATAVINVVEEDITVSVSSNISSNTTWETGKIYILESRIAVLDGATLNIQPGVVVKGEAGLGPNATALMVARGGTIMAEGTANSPIIFTSVYDDIQPGEIESPNLNIDIDGLWGGLIVLGKAPISADAASVQIEGIPASDPNGLYGGDQADDNSGVIRYVSIRHGGSNIGEGNEINGLTLGGVGSATVIENVEIVANQDDGIEFFGGTVDVSNALVWGVGDDAIDTDQSWGGTLDNFAVVSPGDECFELDGPEGAMEDGHILKHGSIYVGSAEGMVDNDANSINEMDSIYFFGLDEDEEQDFDLLPTGVTISNFEVTLPAGLALTIVFTDGSDAFVTEVAEGANTVGADMSEFDGWTWAEVSGALDDAGF